MKNKHPQNSADFINEVEKFSGSSLNKKAELLLIIHEAEKNNKENEFENLIFDAKYIVGLMKLSKGVAENPGLKNIDYMKKDFSENLQKIITLLKEIISSSQDQVKGYFEEKYFVLTGENLINMNELLADLDKIKSYLNEYKRKRMD